jgi:hypothetical protein
VPAMRILGIYIDDLSHIGENPVVGILKTRVSFAFHSRVIKSNRESNR